MSILILLSVFVISSAKAQIFQYWPFIEFKIGDQTIFGRIIRESKESSQEKKRDQVLVRTLEGRDVWIKTNELDDLTREKLKLVKTPDVYAGGMFEMIFSKEYGERLRVYRNSNKSDKYTPPKTKESVRDGVAVYCSNISHGELNSDAKASNRAEESKRFRILLTEESIQPTVRLLNNFIEKSIKLINNDAIKNERIDSFIINPYDENIESVSLYGIEYIPYEKLALVLSSGILDYQSMSQGFYPIKRIDYTVPIDAAERPFNYSLGFGEAMYLLDFLRDKSWTALVAAAGEKSKLNRLSYSSTIPYQQMTGKSGKSIEARLCNKNENSVKITTKDKRVMDVRIDDFNRETQEAIISWAPPTIVVKALKTQILGNQNETWFAMNYKSKSYKNIVKFNYQGKDLLIRVLVETAKRLESEMLPESLATRGDLLLSVSTIDKLRARNDSDQLPSFFLQFNASKRKMVLTAVMTNKSEGRFLIFDEEPHIPIEDCYALLDFLTLTDFGALLKGIEAIESEKEKLKN